MLCCVRRCCFAVLSCGDVLFWAMSWFTDDLVAFIPQRMFEHFMNFVAGFGDSRSFEVTHDPCLSITS